MQINECPLCKSAFNHEINLSISVDCKLILFSGIEIRPCCNQLRWRIFCIKRSYDNSTSLASHRCIAYETNRQTTEAKINLLHACLRSCIKNKRRELIFITFCFSYYAFQGSCTVHFAFRWFLEHQILFDMTSLQGRHEHELRWR